MRLAHSALLLVLVSACSASGTTDLNAFCTDVATGSRDEVTVQGTVARVLGVRTGRSDAHEGFLMRVACPSPVVVRVEANTSFTGTFDLRNGQTVTVRGEYVRDRSGGVIHWTHRDPRGRHPGGYIDLNGTRYQ